MFSKDGGNSKHQKHEQKLIEMDPCEFELPTENNNRSTASSIQLEFDDSEMDSGGKVSSMAVHPSVKNIDVTVEEAVLVGAVSMIHHSNGRYHMTVSDDSLDDKGPLSFSYIFLIPR